MLGSGKGAGSPREDRARPRTATGIHGSAITILVAGWPGRVISGGNDVATGFQRSAARSAR